MPQAARFKSWYIIEPVCAIYTTGSSGSVVFTDLEPGRYWLRISATNYGGDRDIVRRKMEISSDPSFCTAHLINNGVTVEDGRAIVEFAGDGPAEAYVCSLDREKAFPCEIKIMRNYIMYIYIYMNMHSSLCMAQLCKVLL